ncbi:MAG: hypothetical protein LBM13_01875 [Candidatus Ancillula sp.]|jgi:hypothetical protein|nr:hypothetical protein [Candidatus Ancillula sp.]
MELARDEDGILRGSTGAPVDDGSDAFNDMVRSRVEFAKDRGNRIPLEVFIKNMYKGIEERYVQ